MGKLKNYEDSIEKSLDAKNGGHYQSKTIKQVEVFPRATNPDECLIFLRFDSDDCFSWESFHIESMKRFIEALKGDK